MSPHTSRHIVLVALGLLVLVSTGSTATAYAAGSSPAAAGAPVHDATAPNVMREAAAAMRKANVGSLSPFTPAPQAAPALGGSSPLRREVFGFADAGSLADPTRGYPDWNFSLLSTVAFFGLSVAWNGTFINDTGWSVWNSSQLSQLTGLAHSHGTRVVLTIIMQNTPGDSDHGAAMCGALINAQTTADLTAGQVQSKGVDGVNIDYEGGHQTCSNGQTNEAMLTILAQKLRAEPALAGKYLSIDTYASSAADPGGFFDIAGLNQYVDSFFVMEYALEYSNWSAVCSAFCVSPTSPIDGYRYNDRQTNAQYSNLVGSGKVIMGVPYYGDKACVSAPNPNGVSIGYYATSDYLYNKALAAQPGVSSLSSHRDQISGNQERWESYYFSDYACWRELYWDDATSLGVKYDLVNQQNLRGAGIWNLNQGGGQSASPELWNALATHFTLIPGVAPVVSACPGDGFATVSWVPPDSASPITSYAVTASPAPAGGPASMAAGGRATSVAYPGLTNASSYSFRVQASDGYGTGAISAASNTAVPNPPPGSFPGRYHPLTPTRILDTRNGTGGFGTVSPNQIFAFNPLGKGNVPSSGVEAVVLNVTATDTTRPGYLTLYANSTCRPNASNLNFGAYQTVANLVTANLGADGQVAIFNGSPGLTNLVIDVQGYVSAAASTGPDGHYNPIAPGRLLDTRDGTGGKSGPLGPGPSSAFDLVVAGHGGVPLMGSATPPEAVVLNLTVADGTQSSYLAVTPTGAAPAQVSNLNFGPGQTLANRVYVPLSADGRVHILNSEGWANVIVDVEGWFTGAGAGPPSGVYSALTPVRILDTRDGTGGFGGPMSPGQWITVPVAGQLGVPAVSASSPPRAVVLNLTATDPTQPSYLTVDPGTVVHASDLNFTPGQTVANLVVATLAGDGSVHIYNDKGLVNVIVDVVGWYS